MATVNLQRRSLASVLLLVGTVLTLAAPVAAGGAVPRADQSRTVSCAGLDFYPLNSAMTYGATETLRKANGYVLCDPGLPHRAVVTKVTFTLRDATIGQEVSLCALVRSGLTPATAESVNVMAQIPPTGESGFLGTVRWFDATISNPTVDNSKFGYWLQCHISGADDDVGLFGATVTYTISSTDG